MKYRAIAGILFLFLAIGRVYAVDIDEYPTVSYGPAIVADPDVASETALVVLGRHLVQGLTTRDSRDREVTIAIPVRLNLPGHPQDDGTYVVEGIATEFAGPPPAEGPGSPGGSWRVHYDLRLNRMLEEAGVRVRTVARPGRHDWVIARDPEVRERVFGERELSAFRNSGDGSWFFTTVLDTLNPRLDGVALEPFYRMTAESSNDSEGAYVTFTLEFVGRLGPGADHMLVVDTRFG